MALKFNALRSDHYFRRGYIFPTQSSCVEKFEDIKTTNEGKDFLNYLSDRLEGELPVHCYTLPSSTNLAIENFCFTKFDLLFD
jgi:hypothetical protein